MTYPRAHLVDPDGGYYHVCSRCVRRVNSWREEEEVDKWIELSPHKCEKVLPLDTDHSPFFSSASELTNLLIDLATS